MKKIIFMVACLMLLSSCAKKEAVDNPKIAPTDTEVKVDSSDKKEVKSEEDTKKEVDKNNVKKEDDAKAEVPENPVA